MCTSVCTHRWRFMCVIEIHVCHRGNLATCAFGWVDCGVGGWAITDRWKFMGVVGIDLVTCGIEKAIFEKNPGINDPPAWPEETKFKGCMCADTYSYTTGNNSQV